MTESIVEVDSQLLQKKMKSLLQQIANRKGREFQKSLSRKPKSISRTHSLTKTREIARPGFTALC